jgi:hypothetical protein
MPGKSFILFEIMQFSAMEVTKWLKPSDTATAPHLDSTMERRTRREHFSSAAPQADPLAAGLTVF